MEDKELGIRTEVKGFLKLTDEQIGQIYEMTGIKPSALSISVHHDLRDPTRQVAVSVDAACW